MGLLFGANDGIIDVDSLENTDLHMPYVALHVLKIPVGRHISLDLKKEVQSELLVSLKYNDELAQILQPSQFAGQ